MTPTFTVLIGTKCRPSMRSSLDSIVRQGLIPGDQVMIGIDAFEHGDQLEVQSMIRSYGPEFIVDAHVGVNTESYDKITPDGHVAKPGEPYHWLGVEQINHMLRTYPITGSHVFTIGDDDVFVDGAYANLREICARYPLRPIIYKFQAPNRQLLWDIPRTAPCLISGCCIAAPTKYVKQMHTRIETTHDYDWMMDIIESAKSEGHEPVWVDYVGVIARPVAHGHDVVHAGVWHCWACRRWKYREHLDLTNPYCACGVPVDLNSMLPKIVEACS